MLKTLRYLFVSSNSTIFMDLEIDNSLNIEFVLIINQSISFINGINMMMSMWRREQNVRFRPGIQYNSGRVAFRAESASRVAGVVI